MRGIATRSALVLSMAAALALSAVGIASADTARIGAQLSKEVPDVVEFDPRVNEAYAVWTGEMGGASGTDIYFDDISTSASPVNLSAQMGRTAGDQHSPDVSGSRVVYVDGTGSDSTLRWYDLATHTDHLLYDGDVPVSGPSIDGTKVAFLIQNGAQHDVYVIDIANLSAGLFRLTTTSNDEPRVRIDNGIVAFDEIVAGDYHVRVWDLAANKYIFKSESCNCLPVGGSYGNCDISGRRVAFQQFQGGGDDIWVFDAARSWSDSLTLDVDGECINPTIAGDRVYYVMPSAAGGVLYEHDYGTWTKSVVDPGSRNASGGTRPSASGLNVIWNDGRNGRDDIYRSAAALTPSRIAGADRFETAVAAAHRFYGNGVGHWKPMTHVVVASGDDRAAADPLAAAGLCWAYDAPLLLTSAGRMPGSTLSALKQMAADNPALKIIVVGGAASVPDSRLATMRAIVGSGDVERLLSAGNRYDLAAAVSRRMRQVKGAKMPDAVFFANGADPAKFFDALALSALSRSSGVPILLVSKTGLPSASNSELAALASRCSAKGTKLARYVGGGTATVADTVRVAVGCAKTDRWAGSDRYATSAAVARAGIAHRFSRPGYIALAAKIPDALTGGTMVGKGGGVLLVTSGGSLSGSAASMIAENRYSMQDCLVLGGTRSVSTTVMSQVNALVK